MTKLDEIFTIFAEQLNANAQNVMEKNKQVALQTQQTLTDVFNQIVAAQQNTTTPESTTQSSVESNLMIQQLLEQQKMLEDQITALTSNTNQPVEEQPLPIPTPSPVVNHTVETPVSNKQSYDLHINIEKPCNGCPFQSTCTIKDSKFDEECNVSGMKEAAMLAGDMEIHVLEDSVYKVYKNGMHIGNVAQVRENRPFLSQLDFYENQIVYLSTMIKPVSKNKIADMNSVYTKLTAVVTGIEDISVSPTNEESETVNDVENPVIYSPEEYFASLENSSELNTEESFTESLIETDLTADETPKSNSMLGKLVVPVQFS